MSFSCSVTCLRNRASPVRSATVEVDRRHRSARPSLAAGPSARPNPYVSFGAGLHIRAVNQ